MPALLTAQSSRPNSVSAASTSARASAATVTSVRRLIACPPTRAYRLRGRARLPFVDVADRHGQPVLGESPGDREADAPRSTCHDRYPFFSHVCPSRFAPSDQTRMTLPHWPEAAVSKAAS